MKSLLFVRHGQDEDIARKVLNGRREVPLTALGRQQARDAGEKLRSERLTAIISSPLQRTRETAAIIADMLGIADVAYDDRLMERDFGILTGKPFDDIPKYAREIIRGNGLEYFIGVEGAEEYPECFARARAFLDDLHVDEGNGRLLLVAHHDIGKMMIAVLKGWDWKKSLFEPFIHNAEIIRFTDS